ncbi:YgiQ family radical SAM protein [Anaerotruncus sp. 80]|uniref:YgiQ family radical SAM protein n=1 Tax=Anaerotruncus colihominis TaxID=169435 RepID=A0A845QSF0_9FIRM|nr:MULTISPECIES: YgiQ family radical SAM protein [Anaerotruncus]NBH62938.1 YgiQ family radical SAM protein [Anaerotruncus colihominis]NCF03592.1 YgiQ family radical SAM protein [Anaerotruncus sp. 80]
MFLPVTKKEIEDRGWSQVDFVLVSGDAYVDHHSFGTAIIGRLLESHGYKVAILPQPDYKSAEDFRRFGRPRLGFLINGGVVDSMVNNYSVFKRKRKVDEYSPGGISGNRPDRAVIVYSNRAREAYKDVPVIIGGIEASLRRLGHYDYWSDKVRRSILLDAKADLLIYGMGERAVVEIAEALEAGIDVKDITWIEGTCYKAKSFEQDEDTAVLPSYEEITGSKEAYCRSFSMAYRNNDDINGKRLVEKYADSLYVIQNKPQPPLSRQELDDVYELPYENEIHPIYEAAGGIPAFSEIKFSLVSARGCFGGCSFCALTYHQGRQVRSRSKESLVAEARALTQKPDFKGYIHDVGGPTANFRYPACKKQLEYGVCKDKDCLYPRPCKNMEVDHKEYLEVLRAIRQIPGVKKVFIRSGIRYDYVMADKDDAFLRELCKYHVSGTLKVAPEHITDRVLYHMRKPAKEVFIAFADKYRRINQQLGLKQYLIPYLISSHPGSTLDDAVELALFLKEYGFVPDQVQDFYPTPATLATCMYYTEMDPFMMEPVYIAKDLEEKKMQRALIHYHKPENRGIVMKALKKAGREDLVGVLLGGRGRKYESDQRVHKDHSRGRKGVSKGRR